MPVILSLYSSPVNINISMLKDFDTYCSLFLNENLNVSIEEPFDEDGEIDYDADDAVRKIARDRNIGLTSDRNLSLVARDEDGEIIGGAYTSLEDSKYTFDVIVSREAEGKGIGSRLLDKVINPDYELYDTYPDLKVEVDVVNPSMKKMLEKRGFQVMQRIGQERWIMSPEKI